MVDVISESYRIARELMIRFGSEDFQQDEAVAKYAAVVGLTPQKFRDRFACVVTECSVLSFSIMSKIEC